MAEPVIHGRGYKARSQVSRSRRQSKRAAGDRDGLDTTGKDKLVLQDLDDAARKKQKVKLDSAQFYE